MDKWVGSSEKAVRELFGRAKGLRAVAGLPRRDRRVDAAARAELRLRVTDRVVAALLTSSTASNRCVIRGGRRHQPAELIDPGCCARRLEKLVFVEPPTRKRRVDIWHRGKSIPLRDVDLDALAADLDGTARGLRGAVARGRAYAMRRSSTPRRSPRGRRGARENVRPSLDPAQLASLRAFATSAEP